MKQPAAAHHRRSGGMLVYLLLLVALQAFLLVVAVEGVLSHEPRLARAAAGLSVVLVASAFTLRWFLGND